MLLPPLALFQTWPSPNYENPVKRSIARVVFAAVFTPIISAVVLLRIYTRWKTTKIFGVDDTLITLAVIPTLALNSCIIAIDPHFYGRDHSWDVPYATDPANLKMFLASQLIFELSEGLIKLSLLCFYRRLLRAAASLFFRRIILASSYSLVAYPSPICL